MAGEDAWRQLRQELERREVAGRVARLWLRDDDATHTTPALDQLIAVTGTFSIPLTVAAIPAQVENTLVKRLANARHATPVIHGWNHQNHALANQKKMELGDHRPVDEILHDLSFAIGRMSELFGDSLLPMLVPPWNRIGSLSLPHLGRLGFRALSCFGPQGQQASVPVFNTHVDLIDWRGTRGGRDPSLLAEELLTHLQGSGADGKPVGLLTHHLVHDASAWEFLARLFTLTRHFSCCLWVSVADLIALNDEA